MTNLTKMVDGVKYDLTPEEIEQVMQDRAEAALRQKEKEKTLYQDLRRREYPTIEELTVALIEKEEGRPQALEELIIKRAEIKVKYPKPENLDLT